MQTASAVTYALVFFSGITDTRPAQGEERTWDELKRLLTTHKVRTEKGGPLYSPVAYRPESTRGTAGVLWVSCLVLDFDDGLPERRVRQRWHALAYIAHTTHGHRKGAPRWRVLFPLARPVPAAEWPATWDALVAHLGVSPDPACRDAARMWYLPTHPPDQDPSSVVHEGAPLDPTPIMHPETHEPGAPSIETLMERAGRIVAANQGRHRATLWLANQLRDNGYSRAEAEHTVGSAWRPRLPDTDAQGRVDPFSPEECRRVVTWAYNAAPRAPWGPVRAVGHTAPPGGNGNHTGAHGTNGNGQNGHAYVTYNAAQLMALDLPPADFVVPDLLPAGLGILGGKTKTGKSFICLNLGIATAAGGHAFGRYPVPHGEVLYLALEDSAALTRQRLTGMLGTCPAPERLHIANDWRKLDEGGLDDLARWADDYPTARLIMIDVFVKVRPLSRSMHMVGQYEEDYTLLARLKTFAEQRGIAVLILHHLRKMTSDDPTDLLHGSVGMSGAPDTTWIFRRDRGSDDASLFVTGREIRGETTRKLRWEPSTLSFADLGEIDDFQVSSERQEILDLLSEQGEMKVQQIASLLGRSVPATSYLCRKLAAEKTIETTSYGKYRYAKPPPADLF